MADLFTLENLFTLFMLVMLQAVLGFDNLLYISIESKRAPEDKQSYARKLGIGLAIILRILLLFALVHLVEYVKASLLDIQIEGVFEGHFTLHSVIVLVGGAFIIYTATKEILHMMKPLQKEEKEVKPKSLNSVIFWIILMNLVFSFDSILSAMALTDEFIVMATAIVIGGLLMIVMADRVSKFLSNNRLYEVLGLFILMVVGIMLVTEGGELADIHILDNPVEKMSKTTFYFVIVVLVITDIVQSRYQKKIQAELSALEKKEQ
jgi:predicted tellurium resistance membrane protein TerC